MNFEITTNARKNDAAVLSEGIMEFNKSTVPELESNESEVRFFVFARNGKNKITGGIRATCYWNTLHIELLWLSPECRGKGIGKILLGSAEEFAKTNNCEKVFVETTSWQAKPFYIKNGYDLIATLADRPKGYASYYLTKNLL